MLAQHHGLPTRFLDISANPLVGLYFACGGSKKHDGLLYVFATTRDRVKPYDSDAVSIVANFARLRRDEQEAILTETKQFLCERGAFVRSSHDYRIMCRPNGKDVQEIRCYARHMDCLRRKNEAAGRYSYMGRLQTFIEQEKPYFVKDLINPRDLFRIFVVQPPLLFDRVRAQSGAFLVSAYHERFDFDGEKENSQYRSDKYDLPYDYYRFRGEGRRQAIDSGRTEVSGHLDGDLIPGAGIVRERDQRRRQMKKINPVPDHTSSADRT